ncbi:NAD(P)-binding protein [Trematosphaeria pertusa]|uniref:NAD(P)-binding protein n=1 Tax=Trematosphaeria pertusa TaxID=390896 RepID=A0A6A6I6K7_9PLEO|nr:NAD(P)-binding protein [Trematosphaeria pertusa]KAF2245966.1 NAD(P)-binding protein [Trematosphaeria pertusa]
MEAPNLDLGLKGTHVLITGGGGLIGRVVVSHLAAAGAHVSSLDISYPSVRETKPNSNYLAIHCDVSSEEEVQNAFQTATEAYGPVEVCIALASLDFSVLQHSSFADASFAQLKRVLDVNVAGTWLTAREWLRGLRKAKSEGRELRNVNLIIIGSESGHFGERLNADYSLGKSAVQGGLLMSLRQEVVREWPGARVNAVAPGPVDTVRWAQECKENPNQYYLEAQATTALCQSIPQQAVAKSILFLASSNFSSHVHGQVINVDGGKQGKVVWTKEEVQ